MESKPRLGIALCGSFCTFETVFLQLERLADSFQLVPVMSENAAGTDTRFGTAEENRKRLEQLTGRQPISTVEQVEKAVTGALDALLIAPCTGNTLAKLSLGITDTAVTMAAKAHLRNGRPLIVALSTNDGLSGSAENIGRLLNRKNVYFVPFGQDAPAKKPRSLQAEFALMGDTVLAAMAGRQLQPIICSRS